MSRKNLLLLKSFILFSIVGTITTSAETSPQTQPEGRKATSSTYPPFRPGVPPLATSTTLSTSTGPVSTIFAKQEIKKIVSNLENVPEEKKKLHLSTPIGGAASLVIEELTTSSEKSELLSNKIDAYIIKKTNDGVDTSSANAKLEEAKMRLSAANMSISTISELVSSWMNETSTSTYKKAAQSKKNDFKSGAESARKNIRASNDALRAALQELNPELRQKSNNQAGTASSTSGNDESQSATSSKK